MKPVRDPAIDALRVAGVAACVAMHAVVPYMTAPVPDLVWAVREGGRRTADLVFWWGRCAQTTLVFSIAGFVSMSAMEVRGPGGFAAARIRSLGVPLLAGIVFVLPVVAAVWAFGWVESSRATWNEVRNWQFADAEIRRNLFGPAHLWFLEDLLVISIVFAAYRRWRDSPPRLAALSPLFALGGLALIGALLVAIRPQILFATRNTFVPDAVRIVYGGTFFAGGVWLANHRQVIARWPPALTSLSSAALAAGLLIYLKPAEHAEGLRALMLAAAALATAWLSIMGGLRLVNGAGFDLPFAARRAAAMSYAIYVIHLPIVGAAQVLLYGVPWQANVKAGAVFIAGFAATTLVVAVPSYLVSRARYARDELRSVPVRVWTIAAIGLGIALRLLAYARNPDVWQDEAALLVNVLERGYRELLGPLAFHETAPPLFLYIERWIALNVTDSTWAMRLLPLTASCAALVAMIPMTRVVRPRMAPIALLLVACSVKLVDHAVEAKPYSLDALFAAGVGSFFVSTRRWRVSTRAALLAIAAPFVIWVSYPGVFLVAAAAGALLIDRRARTREWWFSFAALAIAVGGSVALLVALPVQAQRTATILEYWQRAFPSALDPFTLVIWSVRSSIGVADYCFRPFGGVLVVPIVIGAFELIRRGERALALLLIGPLALAAIAGVAREYPFGGFRVMMFALPALAVLAAEGLGAMLSRIPNQLPLMRVSVMAIALMPPLVLSGRNVVWPSKRPDTAAATAVVLAARRPGEPVAASAWEYRYYLRRLGPALVRLDERPVPPGESRVWCIVHGDTADLRRERMTALAGPSYRIASTVDLYRVAVFELDAP